MCVIFLAFERHPEFPLVLLANRDEFYARPTAPAVFWTDAPDVFAGRDLVRGGTWLGITRGGRFAAVTNYRDPRQPPTGASRGGLVSDFLQSARPPEEFLENLRRRGAEYPGFNLLCGDFAPGRRTLGYYSNREDRVRILAPGLYGLSNALLDTPWPKVEKGRAALAKLLADGDLEKEKLFAILRDRAPAADAALPETGVGYAYEKLLSSIFIESPVYGTRWSGLVTADAAGRLTLDERIYR